MYKILDRWDLTPDIYSLRVEAPAVARKAQPGQFIVLLVDEKGERIPLTVADWDRDQGSITLVVMAVGTTTHKLACLNADDSILNFAGPLGRPTEIEDFGTVVCVAGGVGAAPMFPIARALKEAGNRCITILGARNKDLLFWDDRLGSVSDELIVTTDDGSYGRKGVVTVPLEELLKGGIKVDRVFAIGPAVMMKFSSLTTLPFGVKTIVSLNSIMVDGTGMCGCCRVSVAGETKFACVDGPDFDGHQVDWDLLMSRQAVYREEEKRSLDYWQSSHKCLIGG